MGYPYTMTYTVNSGDTILADHINTSNQEHINNNIPESTDDYSASVAEMQNTKDPYPASSESQPVTLAEELEILRYQISELAKRFNPSHAQWYHDIGQIRSVKLRLQPGATPGTNINITDQSASTRTFNEPAISNATDMAKSGSSGSFSLNAGGDEITLDITPNVIGILSSHITIHDLNGSSTTAGDIWFPSIVIGSNNMLIKFYQSGSQTAEDFTSILQAGDLCDLFIAFVTST